MKALHTLLAVGALCSSGVPSSAAERKSRLLEFYRYDPSQSVAPVATAQAPRLESDETVSWPKPKPLEEGIRLGKRLSLVPVDDVDLPEFESGSARAELIPSGLMRAYRGGFSVRLPGFDDRMTMYVRSGLSWDLGKGRRFVFPYVSRHIGFRYKREF